MSMRDMLGWCVCLFPSPSHPLTSSLPFPSHTNKHPHRSQNQITTHLKSLPPSTFLAGGPNPTSADYQMLFPLEALSSSRADLGIGKEVRDYVKMVHERCVRPLPSLNFLSTLGGGGTGTGN